jgi:hypothetical protein
MSCTRDRHPEAVVPPSLANSTMASWIGLEMSDRAPVYRGYVLHFDALRFVALLEGGRIEETLATENRWLPRAHRELVFSSRGRRHAARPVPNLSRFRGKLPKPTTPSLSSSTGPLRDSLLFRPRWRRRRDSKPNRRLARKKRELRVAQELHPTLLTRSEQNLFFF